MNLKEKYLEIKEWLSNIEKEKIDFLRENNHSANEKIDLVRNLKYWHDNIEQYKEEYRAYLFGEKIATVEDISKHMLAHISSFEDDVEQSKQQWIRDNGSIDALDEYYMSFEQSFNQDNHDSGYAGISEYNEVKKFWEKLTADDVSYVISGCEDINLDGHRQYWLSRSKVEPLLFSFAHYRTKPLDIDLYNSNDVYDALQEFAIPTKNLPSKDEFNLAYNECVNKHNLYKEENFKHRIGQLIGQFEGDELFKYRVEKLKAMIQ